MHNLRQNKDFDDSEEGWVSAAYWRAKQHGSSMTDTQKVEALLKIAEGLDLPDHPALKGAIASLVCKPEDGELAGQQGLPEAPPKAKAKAPRKAKATPKQADQIDLPLQD